MKAWIMLILAALLETVWAISLKYSNGFTKLLPSLIGIGSAAASFFMLSLALKTLPVGTAYAVWVGIGVVGVVIAGVVILGENSSALRVGFLAMILIGVIGLQVVES